MLKNVSGLLRMEECFHLCLRIDCRYQLFHLWWTVFWKRSALCYSSWQTEFTDLGKRGGNVSCTVLLWMPLLTLSLVIRCLERLFFFFLSLVRKYRHILEWEDNVGDKSLNGNLKDHYWHYQILCFILLAFCFWKKKSLH